MGGKGGRKIQSIREDEFAIDAFGLMSGSSLLVLLLSSLTSFLFVVLSVSAIPVVTKEGKLINSISASNIRMINENNYHLLMKPAKEFLEELQIKQVRMFCLLFFVILFLFLIIHSSHVHFLSSSSSFTSQNRQTIGM